MLSFQLVSTFGYSKERFIKPIHVVQLRPNIKIGHHTPGTLKVALNVGSWDHFEQIPTVTVTFVQVTFVLATFVNIRNISAVISLILTKL